MALPIRSGYIGAAAVLVLVLPAGAGVGDNCPTIWANNADAVVSITTTGTMYNGTIETEHGSGFFVSEDGYLLTANHVVFERPANYRKVDIAVMATVLGAHPVSASVVDVDAADDIALLKVQGAHFRRVVLGTPSGSPVGAPVDVLGFTVGLPASIVPGIISSKPLATAWQTTAPINFGNSGSPVFDDRDGKVIGVATGGATEQRLPDGSVYLVEGVKYFAPLDSYHFPVRIGANVHAPLPQDRIAITSLPEFQVETAKRAAPPSMNLGYHVSFEKTDHPGLLPSSKEFAQTFASPAGYRITKIDGVVAASANHNSTPVAEIISNGKQLVFRVTLTSGPFFDQYRAWYEGTVLTEQTAIRGGPQ